MRCFFNLADASNTIFDHEGIEILNVNQARQLAIEAIDDARRADPGSEVAWADWTLVAVDEGGSVLFAVQLGGRPGRGGAARE